MTSFLMNGGATRKRGRACDDLTGLHRGETLPPKRNSMASRFGGRPETRYRTFFSLSSVRNRPNVAEL